jgi:mevalonate kinase
VNEVTFSAHGKWILAGEHAVLRGSPALVFPVANGGMTLRYDPGPQPLQLKLEGERGEELKLLAWGVIENGAKRLEHNLVETTGTLTLSSNLPIGAGLGASAVLCVVITRWFQHLGWIHGEKLYDFARGLEDLFHGESSGVDIAVALGDRGLRFIRGGERAPLEIAWRPRIYLSYSGVRGVTSECVAKVKALNAANPAFGEEIDARMRLAVERAELAMASTSESRFGDLAEAIEMAGSCFRDWGLCEGAMGDHLSWLRGHGAAAVKPTGSGGGGYAVSLWRHPPPLEAASRLQAVF